MAHRCACGRPDVVETNLANQCWALYRNAGDGTFSYDTHASGIGRISLLSSGWGVRFLDFDNDGWKDLFLARGHVLDTARQYGVPLPAAAVQAQLFNAMLEMDIRELDNSAVIGVLEALAGVRLLDE